MAPTLHFIFWIIFVPSNYLTREPVPHENRLLPLCVLKQLHNVNPALLLPLPGTCSISDFCLQK